MWGEPVLRPALARAAAHILLKSGCFLESDPRQSSAGPFAFDLATIQQKPRDYDRLLDLAATALAPLRPDYLASSAGSDIPAAAMLADRVQAKHIHNDQAPAAWPRARERVVIAALTSSCLKNAADLTRYALASADARTDALFVLFDERTHIDIDQGAQRIYALTDWAQTLEVMHLTGYGDAALRADLESYLKTPASWRDRSDRAVG